MGVLADEHNGDSAKEVAAETEEVKIVDKGFESHESQTGAHRPFRGVKNPAAIGVILLIAGVAVAMVQYKVPTIMTTLMVLFSMDAQTASWLMSIFTLVGIFMAIPSGMLARRFGAKRMMLVSCVVAAGGSLIGVFAQISAVLILSRAIEGCALTVLTTCGPIVVRQCVSPEKTGTAMGIWGIWGCIGSTVAALVVPTMFDAIGFSGVWIVFAVIVLAAAVLVLVTIRVPSEEKAVRKRLNPGEVKEEAASEQTSLTWGIVRRAFFSRDVLLFFAAFALFNILLLAILSYVPTILQMQGFDPTLSGLVSTLPMCLSIISSPLFGVISDRIGRVKPLLAIALLVMGPCTFIIYTQTNAILWVAVLIMGLVGMGSIGMFLSGYSKLVPDPSLASLSMGVLICIQGLGQFLGSFLVQLLLGPDLTQWLFAGVVLFGMGILSTVVVLLCRLR